MEEGNPGVEIRQKMLLNFNGKAARRFAGKVIANRR